MKLSKLSLVPTDSYFLFLKVVFKNMSKEMGYVLLEEENVWTFLAYMFCLVTQEKGNCSAQEPRWDYLELHCQNLQHNSKQLNRGHLGPRLDLAQRLDPVFTPFPGPCRSWVPLILCLHCTPFCPPPCHVLSSDALPEFLCLSHKGSLCVSGRGLGLRSWGI